MTHHSNKHKHNKKNESYFEKRSENDSSELPCVFEAGVIIYWIHIPDPDRDGSFWGPMQRLGNEQFYIGQYIFLIPKLLSNPNNKEIKLKLDILPFYKKKTQIQPKM